MAAAAGSAPAGARTKVELSGGDQAHEHEGHITLIRQREAINNKTIELQDLSSQASRDGAALHVQLKAAKQSGQDLTELKTRKAEILQKTADIQGSMAEIDNELKQWNIDQNKSRKRHGGHPGHGHEVGKGSGER